jgi:hypothetical protein
VEVLAAWRSQVRGLTADLPGLTSPGAKGGQFSTGVDNRHIAESQTMPRTRAIAKREEAWLVSHLTYLLHELSAAPS